jgi:hypothetical protein
MSYLFQENKSYGDKPFAFILWYYIVVRHKSRLAQLGGVKDVCVW